MKLSVLYAILASIATLTNVLAQDLLLRLYQGPAALQVSVLWGTAVGLVVKYVLDKRYVFGSQARDLRHDGRTFLLYTLMGVVTTLLFWATEAAFHLMFQSKAGRYSGAVLGLALGYAIKYRLDRRFVFRDPS